MTQLRTIRKELERKLEVYSVDELIVDCRRVLQELREYPSHNSYQIKYYERFWLLLSKY
jgi:tRNA A22 N-methylase